MTLFAVEMDLLLADHVPSSQFIQLWAAFGPDPSYTYAGKPGHPVLTPGGLALTWVDEAAQGAAGTGPITFRSAPVLSPGGSPALIGQFFSSPETRQEVLVNLSPHALRITAGAAIPSGAPYKQVTLAGSPIQQASAASRLTIRNGSVSASLTMPAYSMIVIR